MIIRCDCCRLSVEALTWPLPMWVLFGQHTVGMFKSHKISHKKSDFVLTLEKKIKRSDTMALIQQQSERASVPAAPYHPPAQWQLPCDLVFMAFSLTVTQSHSSEVKIIHKAIQWTAHSYLISNLPKHFCSFLHLFFSSLHKVIQYIFFSALLSSLRTHTSWELFQ